MKNTRAALMGGVALLAIAAVAQTSPAQAQVQAPGFFGSATGWWYPWNSTGSKFNYFDSDDANSHSKPGDGPGGKAYAGYRFSNPYDIAVGLQGTWLSKGKKGNAIDSGTPSSPFNIQQKAWYWAGDVELGYNGSDGMQLGYRLFAGARYVEWKHTSNGLSNEGGNVTATDKFTGWGPRIGASGAYRFGPGSNWSLFADVAGAYLLGSRHAHATTGEGPGSAKNGKNSWNAEGEVGLSYDVGSNVNIGAGYRGEYWSNVAFSHLDKDDASIMFGGANRIVHGPFVRVAYNIGAPKGVPVAAPPPAPAAVMTKNFIVFFDFDRSDLSPQSRATIKQAADASKTGGVQRVGVTGHADKSGPDAYNMALSLRRANNVKDELVRDGVPAASIVVVGRGESQPLVPTADGVREPQNRRVEIVLQ